MTCAYSKHCIGQIHEWTDAFRKRSPQWSGRGELDYYTWRFDRTLARIGWAKLNYRNNSPNRIDERTLQRWNGPESPGHFFANDVGDRPAHDAPATERRTLPLREGVASCVR